MQRNQLFLAATLLAAFGLAGCNALRTLTEPPDGGLTGPYTFSLSTNLSNTAGVPTVIDAQILIDNVVVADSCPQQDEFPQTDGDGNITYFCEAPASGAVNLGTGGHIGPGMHTIRFFISSQTGGNTPTPYIVMAFSIQVNDAQGNPLKTLSLPAQSASLRAGQSIVYEISI